MAPSTPPPPSRDSLAALTMASTSSRVMSPSTTSIVVMLPVTDGTGVEMHEAGARIEADAAHLQRTRRLPDLEHRHARETDVHGVAVHVLAVARHAAAHAGEPGVGGGRTVGRQDFDRSGVTHD